jgi:magnesium-transporting ATPase (P-type)
VLIKNAEVLELLARVDALVVDKTGTLTEGRPRLTAIDVADGWTEDEVLRLAAPAASIRSRLPSPAKQTRGIWRFPPSPTFARRPGRASAAAWTDGRSIWATPS